MKYKKRKTVRVKIVFIITIYTLFIVVGSWMISKYLMRILLENRAKADLVRLFERCNTELNYSKTENESFGGPIENIPNPQAIAFVIRNAETGEYYTAINDKGLMMKNLENVMAGFENGAYDDLREPGKYKICSGYVEAFDDYYMDLVGRLDNGYQIAARMPMERINSTLESISTVFVIISLILSAIGVVVIVAVSGLYVNNINRISRVARKMASLDFDEKIPVNTYDELGELSDSMNLMSVQLEDSITKLKAANIKLQQDISEKEKLDVMKTEFLSNVSHELKTPIALIQGYSEGLRDNISDDPESIQFYSEVIIDEAKKMNSLVKKLLDLNEIEFGNNRLNIERFELNAFIKTIVTSHKLLIDEKQAKVEYDFAEEQCFVWADEYMIEEAFTNYLTNAIHYVINGGTIKITTKYNDGNVRVSVYNDGKLIPDDDIPRLFDKFYKIDKARTREYGGNGIGLSIVAAAIDAHGKNYGVYNEENGVSFYFELDAKCLEE